MAPARAAAACPTALGALRPSRARTGRTARSTVRKTSTTAQLKRDDLGVAAQTAMTAAQTTLATAVLTAPSAAWAEEVAAQAARAPPSLNPFSGVSTTEAITLSAPVILYVIFSAARTQNPALKFGDFMFGLVALAVFGNIFAILALKIRIF